MSLSVDSTSSTSINCHFIVSIDTEKLTSNSKPHTTACLGAWYTWDRILQTSLEGKAFPDTCLKILASCDRYSQGKVYTFIYVKK
ncbi:unnamed protein product [Brassica oleracea]